MALLSMSSFQEVTQFSLKEPVLTGQSSTVHVPRREAELWKAAYLFKTELALVDRWRPGE
jgi:hypothetical protein